MGNFLWSFTNGNNNQGLGYIGSGTTLLPGIVPAGLFSLNSILANGSNYNTPHTIDVVKDFYWTYSKPGDISRSEVPYILLTERKLKSNALIAQLKYSYGRAYSSGTETLNNLLGTTGTLGTAIGNDINGASPSLAQLIKSSITATANGIGLAAQGTANLLGGAGTAIANAIPRTTKEISKYGAAVVDAAINATSDNNTTVNSSPYLEPYRDLYITDVTGWKYKLPYFDNNQANQGNSFSENGKVGGLGELFGIAPAVAEFGTAAAEIVSSINSPTEITYIERTKFYNYPTEGEDINIEFPLINTGEVTYDDVVRNWQFLFLLVYQNRPAKTSRNTVDQPVIYQAEIPGIKFFPFCYMTSINIEFVGSRREMSLSIPSGITSNTSNGTAGDTVSNQVQFSNVNAIIPDAYRVRLSLKSMTANSRNFMQHMVSTHNLIETGTVGG